MGRLHRLKFVQKGKEIDAFDAFIFILPPLLPISLKVKCFTIRDFMAAAAEYIKCLGNVTYLFLIYTKLEKMRSYILSVFSQSVS